ncbi:hypothetical protein [Methylibium sp.]|uniref:hypothetical protein n=1 Tax=Methylibium sp. TaxID=2067992 RepID=UPI003D130541
MTCIAAIVENGVVHMAADSAGVGGLGLHVRRDRKIHRIGDMLIGFTSSFRMGQLIGYSLAPPLHDPKITTDRYMVTVFVDALRHVLKAGGYARVENNTETGGRFLVGYRGRLFIVDSDFQVGESVWPFGSVGCGDDLAKGALFATRNLGMTPAQRLAGALEAAEEFSAGVRGPWVMETLQAHEVTT